MSEDVFDKFEAFASSIEHKDKIDVVRMNPIVPGSEGGKKETQEKKEDEPETAEEDQNFSEKLAQQEIEESAEKEESAQGAEEEGEPPDEEAGKTGGQEKDAAESPEEDGEAGEDGNASALADQALDDSGGESAAAEEKKEEATPVDEGYTGEKEDDDSVFDPQDESLIYAPAAETQIDFSDLNDGGTDDGGETEGEEEPDEKPDEKKDFNDIVRTKKEFVPGRLNKSVMLAVIGGAVALLLVMFNVLSIKKNHKDKKSTGSRDTVNVEGYKPDFGDYESRKYKPTEADKEAAEAAYAQQLMNGKQEYKPEPEPEPKKASSGGGGGGGSSQWQQAAQSGMRVQDAGFGRTAAAGGMTPQTETGGLQGIAGRALAVVSQQPESKEQYAQQYMSQLAGVSRGLGLGGGGQEESQGVNNGRFTQAGQYNPSAAGGSVTAIPENSLYPGTVIPAVLISGINTDYPGTITAQTTIPVYDSKTAKHLLIPQGSRLRGSYSSSSIGIAKVQIAWQQMIINRDGVDFAVDLGSMVGVDSQGYSGVKGSLNDHAFQYIKAMGIMSLFTTLNAQIYSYSNAQKNALKQQLIQDNQDIASKLGDKILNRALDIQPTVIVKPGTRINVDVDRILTLVPFKNDPAEGRYIRR